MANNNRTNANTLPSLSASSMADLMKDERTHVSFTKQYRMVPQLADLMRAIGVYDATTTNGPGTAVESRPIAIKFQEFLRKHYDRAESSLLFVSCTGTPLGKRYDDALLANAGYAKIVWTIVRKMLDDGFNGSDIAIIVPSVDQQRFHRAVQKGLTEASLKTKDITLWTIEECSGKEAPIVIADLGINNIDDQLLGKALSRSRDGLILVGETGIPDPNGSNG